MNGPDAAKLFREMADRIERNAEEFSGAYLVVPPDVNGVPAEAVDGLSVTTKPNLAAFWSGVQGAVELAVATLRDAEQRGGMRR